jgi:hypothetical protein
MADARDEEIKNLRAELSKQRELSGLVKPQSTPAADQFQYIKLPDGSYGKFDANASDAFIKAQVLKDFPNASFQPPAPPPQATPAGELAAGPGPIERGLSAAGESASKGVLGTLAAPGVGLGEAAGTTAQNLIARILGKTTGYNPSGITGDIAAAGGALANAGGTLLGDTATGKAVVGGAKSLLNLPETLSTLTKAQRINKAAGIMGQETTAAGRILNPFSNKVKAAYDLADIQAPLQTSQLLTPVRDTIAIGKDLAGKTSKKILDEVNPLLTKFSSSNTINYNNVLGEVQGLRATARAYMAKTPRAAKALNDLSETLLDKLDNISPIARNAGKLARKEIYANDVNELIQLGTSNAADKLSIMMQQNPRIAESFGLTTKPQIDRFIKLANNNKSKLAALGHMVGGAATYATLHYLASRAIRGIGE